MTRVGADGSGAMLHLWRQVRKCDGAGGADSKHVAAQHARMVSRTLHMCGVPRVPSIGRSGEHRIRASRRLAPCKYDGRCGSINNNCAT